MPRYASFVVLTAIILYVVESASSEQFGESYLPVETQEIKRFAQLKEGADSCTSENEEGEHGAVHAEPIRAAIVVNDETENGTDFILLCTT
uniref:Secreted protein n=1 Tax=Ascaris lumbricoides TaxID=6252 RepID=A0A0M3HN64_ASCLU